MNLILLNYLITVKYPCHPCSIPLRQSVIAFSASSANLNFFQRFGNTKDTKNLKNTKEKRLNQHVHSILWNTERHRKELKTLKWPERKPCPYNTLQGVSFRAPTRNPVPFHLYCHAEFISASLHFTRMNRIYRKKSASSVFIGLYLWFWKWLTGNAVMMEIIHMLSVGSRTSYCNYCYQDSQ